MREAGALWDWLYKAQKPMERTWLYRVENAVGAGECDVEGVHDGGQFKCELKIGDMKANGVVSIHFQPLQVPFLTRWWRAGGMAFLLIRVDHNMPRYPKKFLIRGGDVEGLFTNVRDEQWEARLVDLDWANLLSATPTAEEAIEVMSGKWL